MVIAETDAKVAVPTVSADADALPGVTLARANAWFTPANATMARIGTQSVSSRNPS
jgi:hypothetical protein